MGSMKVLFDHQIFDLQRYGGISRYFVELMERFSSDPEMEASLATWHSSNQHLAASSLQGKGIVPPAPPFLGMVKKAENITGRRIEHRLNRNRSLREVGRGRFDVLHPTYYHPYFLDRLHDRPFVLTVYDMIHELFSEQFPRDDRTARNKNALVERADRIIAISMSTKNDLVRLYGVSPNKIDVVHLGTSMVPAQAGEWRPNGLPSKYILFVGNRGGYKNFAGLAEAMAPLMKARPDLHLVCAGGGFFSEAEKKRIAQLGIMDRTVRFDIDDRILAALYANARLFVFPSLYEGFGIPILEAFACRCPLLVSSTSSFPEVAGDAALYYDCNEPSSLNQALENALDQPRLLEQLVEKGTIRLKEFSWERAARETKAVYGRVL